MKDFLLKYLSSHPDAVVWLSAYLLYLHAIDDIIDGDKTDANFIIDTFCFSPVIYTNHFFLTNYSRLYPLSKMAFRSYQESVLMERSGKKWHRHYADVLRQNANEVILEVVEIVGGIEQRKLAALELREISYKTHHDESGKPI